jgi:hypothetical protein
MSINYRHVFYRVHELSRAVVLIRDYSTQHRSIAQVLLICRSDSINYNFRRPSMTGSKSAKVSDVERQRDGLSIPKTSSVQCEA